MELSVRLEKKLGAQARLEIELEVAGPRVFALFGPSGSGKTMLLRCLAGLEAPEHGYVRFGGETWFSSGSSSASSSSSDGRRNLRPQERQIGFLFQNSALFPHLSVLDNLKYGTSAGSVREWVDLLDLGALTSRFPGQLSAGERQRVALARALATRPKLLMLDEPFTALDQPARERLRLELKRVLAELGIPALLVTHDRAEALSLADGVGLIVEGKIRQTGMVSEVFARPLDAASARAVGFEMIVAAEMLGERARAGWNACIRGEDVRLDRGSAAVAAPADGGQDLVFPNARVAWISREGPISRVGLDAGFPLIASLGRRELEQLGLAEGERVHARVDRVALHWVAK